MISVIFNHQGIIIICKAYQVSLKLHERRHIFVSLSYYFLIINKCVKDDVSTTLHMLHSLSCHCVRLISESA